MKDSGVKDSGFDNNIDEYQQKLIAEMQRDIQHLKNFAKDAEGGIKNNRKEIDDLRRKLSNMGNNFGGQSSGNDNNQEIEDKLDDLLELIAKLQEDIKTIQG